MVTTAADRFRVARASTTKETRDRGALDAQKAAPGGDGDIEKAYQSLEAAIAVLVES